MITIRVPGTTANLGPGFDCLGLALGVYGYFTFEERESGLEFENVAPAFQNEDNLAIRGYRRAMQEMGLDQPGIYLHIESDIPVSSGLGKRFVVIIVHFIDRLRLRIFCCRNKGAFFHRQFTDMLAVIGII